MTEADMVVWHDLEHCGYRADLPIWRALAGRAGPSSVVELGAGTGRVSLALAADGHRITAVDRSEVLLAALRARRTPGATLDTLCCDVRDLRLDRHVDTVLAPALMVQLAGGPRDRRRLFDSVADILSPGGVFAAACDGRLPIVRTERSVAGTRRSVNHSGRTWTSELSSVRGGSGSLVLTRTRAARATRSTCTDEVLERLALDTVAAEASESGLRESERFEVPATGLHSAVTVMVFRVP